MTLNAFHRATQVCVWARDVFEDPSTYDLSSLLSLMEGGFGLKSHDTLSQFFISFTQISHPVSFAAQKHDISTPMLHSVYCALVMQIVYSFSEHKTLSLCQKLHFLLIRPHEFLLILFSIHVQTSTGPGHVLASAAGGTPDNGPNWSKLFVGHSAVPSIYCSCVIYAHHSHYHFDLTRWDLTWEPRLREIINDLYVFTFIPIAPTSNLFTWGWGVEGIVGRNKLYAAL